VRAEHGLLEVQVEDDGAGVRSPTRRSGLSNLRRRAEARGGALQVGTPNGHGVVLTWRVPLT
jgi:signal transduction histidine kinase